MKGFPLFYFGVSKNWLFVFLEGSLLEEQEEEI